MELEAEEMTEDAEEGLEEQYAEDKYEEEEEEEEEMVAAGAAVPAPASDAITELWSRLVVALPVGEGGAATRSSVPAPDLDRTHLPCAPFDPMLAPFDPVLAPFDLRAHQPLHLILAW